jgi:superfamily II DNA or RNA helicase
MKTLVSPGVKAKIAPPPFLPYDYQEPIIKDMVQTIVEGKSGLVIQPTATGKSVEAAFTARACILLHGMKGLYLYNENEGLAQARKKFQEIFAANPIKCASYFGYGKEDLVHEADMVFASFQSLNSQHGKWYLNFVKDHFGFVIVNEAHHSQADTYKEVIEYFECGKIGMTATEKRMDGRDIRDLFPHIICEIRIEEAIARKWVAIIEYHVLLSGLSTQKLKKICAEWIEEGKHISIKQLNENIFVEMYNQEVLKEIYKYAFPEDGSPRQVLLFCENIDHVKEMLRLLLEDGMSAGAIHSKQFQSKNRTVMNGFRAGEVQFLVSVNKLNEDIDLPDAEVAALLRSTDSETVFTQQFGRLLRKSKRKEKAIYLDFVANADRIIAIQNMVQKIEDFVIKTGDGLLQRGLMRVVGHGFDFSFSDELRDIMTILSLMRAQKDMKSMNKSELSEIIKDILKSKSITDYWTLKMASRFGTMRFPLIGTGYVIMNTLLGKEGESILINAETIDRFADNLGWLPSENEKKARYYQELSMHGITDYWTLKAKGANFFKLTFSIGSITHANKRGGMSFVNLVLGTNSDERNLNRVEELANFLGWIPTEEEVLVKYKDEFKKNGIVDSETLLKIGIEKFKYLSFGIFGKGVKFLSLILKERSASASITNFKLVAKKLGWSELDKNYYLELLKKHQIIDYATLMAYGGYKFEKLDFGSLGKGGAFASSLLNKSTKVSNDILKEIAEKLGWSFNEESRREWCKKILQQYGITDYWTLTHKYSWSNFTKLSFPGFTHSKEKSKGISFMGLALDTSSIYFPIESRKQLASLLGWIVSEEEKKLRYKQELQKNRIHTRNELLSMPNIKLVYLDFGIFGKSKKFFSTVLENESDFKNITKDMLEKVAEKIGLE